MLNALKAWVLNKTIQYAESRYGIFVWMRQINDRIIRLEQKQAEQAVQERAETEAFFDAKIQKAEGRIDEQRNMIEILRLELDELKKKECACV